jgi:drug/metabolite transporter (DMT)-like permease
MSKIASDKPVVTILTLVAALVAIVVGGIVTITNPQSLSFHQYVQDVSLLGAALGLGAGVGRGIDSYGQSMAQAQAPPVAPPAADAPPTDDR